MLRWVRRHFLRGLRSHLGMSYGTTLVSILLEYRRRLAQNKDIGQYIGDIECLQGGFSQHQRLFLEAERGADVISRFTESTWLEFTLGLALVLWRRVDHINLAQDDCPPFLLRDPPNSKWRTPSPSAEKH
jgi:hypothetical protein